LTFPHLEPEDLFWRLFFTIGAMAHTLAAGGMLGPLSGGVCDPSNMGEAIERLVHYTGAGMRAPTDLRRIQPRIGPPRPSALD
jgi:hypothetical protein